MPQLTILIPTYNCARYILECVNSLLVQDYTDFELLIIDDGSTDDTEEIINAIKDKRIVYLKNSVNIGIVATLNKGLKLAKGKYIARMDADDVVLGNRLEKQIFFLEHNPEYGMVGAWFKLMDEQGSFLRNVKNSINPDFLRLGLIFTNHFAHPSVMMRTGLARKLKYNKDYLHCEDHDLWLRFAEVSKVTNLPDFFLSVRAHAKSTCSLNQKQLKISVISLLSRELDKIQVPHNIEELMLHAAVCFGNIESLIKNQLKYNALLAWHERIFLSPILKQRYSAAFLKDFKKEIQFRYCGIREEKS